MEYLRVFHRENLLWGKCAYKDSLFFRCKGLLGKSSLDDYEALWLKPCNSIHMFFMKFPIDAIFLDKENRVVKIYHSIKPWRMTPLIWNAHSVLEVKAGRCAQSDLRVGDQLSFQ
jgi:hypothetical protein